MPWRINYCCPVLLHTMTSHTTSCANDAGTAPLRPMSRTLAAAAAVAALLGLVGCGSSSAKTPGQAMGTVNGQRVTASVAAGQTSIDSEGSVLTDDGKFIAYPDGFTIRFENAVDLENNELGFEVPAANTLIRVTLSLENKTPQAIPLDGNNTYMGVQYGSARYDAEVAGFAGDKRTLMDPAPNRVAPGSTLYVYRTFSVPKADVGSIRVTPNIEPDRYTTYTFTEVGKVVH